MSYIIGTIHTISKEYTIGIGDVCALQPPFVKKTRPKGMQCTAARQCSARGYTLRLCTARGCSERGAVHGGAVGGKLAVFHSWRSFPGLERSNIRKCWPDHAKVESNWIKQQGNGNRYCVLHGVAVLRIFICILRILYSLPVSTCNSTHKRITLAWHYLIDTV